MRLVPLAVCAALALLGSGCAPEGMADQAVPVRQAMPSVVSPAAVPVKAPSVAVPTAVEEVEVAVALEQEPTTEATMPVAEPQEPVEKDPAPAPTTVRPTASVVPTAPASESQWRDVNLDSIAYSDAHKLEQVSPSFRDYAQQAMTAADTDGCTVLGLSVLSMHPDAYVVGSVSTDCGGGQAIWVEKHDGWKVATVLQGLPLCSDLSAIGLPTGVGLLCDNGGGGLSEF